ncbi:MAG: UV DNA damage repair endonuclease UvsE [Chloroflexota bacterium]
MTIQYHLGFPVNIKGAPIRSHDSRRWQNQPHLTVSLAYVRDIFEYLHSQSIRFYRLSGQLAPYLTHPDMPQFHRQLDESSTELATIGDLARAYRIRLSLHPAFYVQLSSPDPTRVERSCKELNMAAHLLDEMGMDDNAVLLIHVGGLYDDRQASLERFVRHWETLPNATQCRLAVEHDDRRFSLQDVLWLHKQTGIRVVFDVLHHYCLNHCGRTVTEGLMASLATWPATQKPKIHVSSPRTAVRTTRRSHANGAVKTHLQLPLANQHSDFIDPFFFINFMRTAQQQTSPPFDIMLEAKAKDLALLHLRTELHRFAPDLSTICW